MYNSVLDDINVYVAMNADVKCCQFVFEVQVCQNIIQDQRECKERCDILDILIFDW